MDKEFALKIVTPDREFFSGAAESLTIRTPTGSMGILYHTLPLVAVLSPGVLRIRRNGRWMEAVNADGFVTVLQEGVTVLTQACEWPHELSDQAENGGTCEWNDDERRDRSQYEYKTAKAKMTAQFVKLGKKGRDG